MSQAMQGTIGTAWRCFGDGAVSECHPAGLRILRRSDQPIEAFQVYGQRCSGTHAIIRLIEANFGPAAFTELYGFKHWFVPEQMLFPASVMVVVIARDPVEWIQSLHRNPWHAHQSLRGLAFGDFIRAPWHSVWDEEFWSVDRTHPIYGTEMMHERDPRTGRRFANAIAKRTAKLRHWADLHTRAHNLALVNAGLVRSSPARLVASLAEATGLRPAHPFVPIDTYKGHGIKRFIPPVYPDLSPVDQAHLRTWLDPDVEALFGFENGPAA